MVSCNVVCFLESPVCPENETLAPFFFPTLTLFPILRTRTTRYPSPWIQKSQTQARKACRGS
jgi:hypothetical protein